MTATEGKGFSLPSELHAKFRSKLWAVSQALGLRFRPFSEIDGVFTIMNLVGSIDLGGVIIDILPKTEPTEDWVSSIVSLLATSDRIEIAGRRRAGFSPAKEGLADALAKIYLDDLRMALRRDGPITAIVRAKTESVMLRGKLQVSELARRWTVRPTQLPQTVTEISDQNDFSRALAAAAVQLGGWCRDYQTKNGLLSIATKLSHGDPTQIVVPSGISGRSLPPQWNAYKSSWAIASAVLSRRSLLGVSGLQLGPALVIEPWPLLERLLERSLAAFSSHAKSHGRNFRWSSQEHLDILRPIGGGAAYSHQLKPDGVMIEDDMVVATFEAKYRDYSPDQGPLRSEIYQAISAARAASSPIAVLVYPGRFPTSTWRVAGRFGDPLTLATVGLEMFSYRWGDENERGKVLYDLVTNL
ncbi:5-methylcytosine restriction system specificity protein McrC [Rhizobium laguerreae]|uniref:Restriction endonuclease n=1 Tax=Rhizobium laguerreae TaxID=1076926 RepID=A0A6N9ZN68_9HYPH|nr:hypothetical protein [Rhizobium laguerreae]NEH94974.1 hypothetical protein [Rhizobium laguerreae]